MVQYLLTLNGIRDPMVEDGTTAFSMALASKNKELITVLMKSKHQCDFYPCEMAKRALQELGDTKCYPEGLDEGLSMLNETLVDGLMQNDIYQALESPEMIRCERSVAQF